MRWLLCALAVGLFASAPAYADDDDKPFKDYYKRLREQQKKQAKFYREQQKRQEEFLREQRKRQEEMFREHRWQPYPAPGGWPPYGTPGNGGYYDAQPFALPPFAQGNPYLQPGTGSHYVQPFAPPFPFAGYPESVFPSRRYSSPYFNLPPVRLWRGDDDDDDDDD